MQESQLGLIRATMKPVAEAFEILNVPYAVVGSVAGLSHGFSRFTMDVDVIAFMTLEIVDEFVRRLEDDYYVDAAAIRDAIRHHHSFNLICNANGMKVDVFIPLPRAWDLQVAQRREPETMDEAGPAFWVQSAEDLVLSKLHWYRMTQETSERQWGDVLGVLKLQQFDLDLDYLEKWARELTVDDLLQRALNDAGLR